MTVNQLKNLLNDFNGDLDVTVSNYDDDSNGSQVFESNFGVEQIKVYPGKEIVAIYLSDDLKSNSNKFQAEPEGSGVVSNDIAMEEHPGLKEQNKV